MTNLNKLVEMEGIGQVVAGFRLQLCGEEERDANNRPYWELRLQRKKRDAKSGQTKENKNE